jgi:acetyltransferase-like isoleucine patch superfamily enzyme
MIRKTLATSDHWFPRMVRSVRQAVNSFSVPAPRILTMPLVGIVIAIRSAYYFLARVFVCEPFFKAYCTSYGKNLHTGVFLHWVQGRGRLIIGDDVTVDGKCNFHFGARRSVPPTLTIGSNTSIGHGCTFAVNKQVTIGRGCLIAGFVSMFDSPGHSTDPAERAAGVPVTDEEVRPVVVEDNVWVGYGSVIMPGVTIGKNSVVAVGSVVTSDIPPNTMALGNPARKFPLAQKDTATSLSRPV